MLKLVFDKNLGELPTSQYHLEDRGKNVGFIQIRHQPSHAKEVPPDFASHIYYEIDEEKRGRGYGGEIFKLGLIEAGKIGLTKIVVTCHDDNTASKKIIEANGGVLKESCIIPADIRQIQKPLAAFLFCQLFKDLV